MTPANLPAVLAIERVAFPTPWTEAMFRSACRGGVWTAWVARIDQMVVGYIVFALVVDECDLLNIAIAPTARRQGCARLLLSRMFDDVRARGAHSVWLDVRASNAVAQSLYRSFGFAVVGRRRRYYAREGEDALVMSLTFPPDN